MCFANVLVLEIMDKDLSRSSHPRRLAQTGSTVKHKIKTDDKKCLQREMAHRRSSASTVAGSVRELQTRLVLRLIKVGGAAPVQSDWFDGSQAELYQQQTAAVADDAPAVPAPAPTPAVSGPAEPRPEPQPPELKYRCRQRARIGPFIIHGS